MSPLLLAAAFIADLLLGDPRWLPHPVVGIGRLIAGLENLLYQRIPARRLGGLLLAALTLLLTGILTWGGVGTGHPPASGRRSCCRRVAGLDLPGGA